MQGVNAGFPSVDGFPFRCGHNPADMRKCFFLLPLFFLYAHTAAAIINVEDAAMDKAEEGASGRVDVSASGNTGNSDKFGIRAGGLLQWRQGRHVSIGIASYAYGSSQGRSYANRGFVHVRHRVRLSGPWSVEGFVQAERDDFARLSLRGLAGAGLRWQLLRIPDDRAAWLGLGAMFEHERLRFQAGATDARVSDVVRGNAYLVLKSRLNAQTRFISTTYFQPDLTNPSDFRLLENASIDVRLAGAVDVRLSLEVRHDSRPPQQVRKTDVTYASGLVYHF